MSLTEEGLVAMGIEQRFARDLVMRAAVNVVAMEEEGGSAVMVPVSEVSTSRKEEEEELPQYEPSAATAREEAAEAEAVEQPAPQPDGDQQV
ncbi:hypothetical protein HDU96_009969 [Phlyctochytrium bullatum]|nr:hypothetical protein HDU96_009969 [Phlyctochytrium bullatum]